MKLKREYAVQDIKASEDGTYEIAFSSESPVQREIENEYGHNVVVNEILVHDGPENADLTRINNGAALLFNHDFDNHLGIVVPGSVRIDSDRIGRAIVKFSKHGQLAQEIQAKVDEGTISKISFGYDLDEYHLDGQDLLVTKWSPYEISFVTVPADDKVGLGRTLNISVDGTAVKTNSQNKGNSRMKRIDEMTTEELLEMTIAEIEALSEEDRKKRELVIDEAAAEAEAAADVEAEQVLQDNPGTPEQDVLTAEEREEEIAEIEEIAERYKIERGEVRKAIAKNMTARQFKRSIKPNKAPAVIRKMEKDTQANIEAKFDLNKVVRSRLNGTALNGREAEYHQEMLKNAQRSGKEYRGGAFIPASVLAKGSRAGQTSATLAPVTEITQRYDSLVDILLPQSVLGKLNVNTLTGLDKPISVPKFTKSAVDNFGWVPENGDRPLGEMTTDNVNMSPFTFAGGVAISRKSVNTLPNIGDYIADHIVKASRIKLEQAVFSATATTNFRDGIAKQLIDAGLVKTGAFSYKAFLAVIAELTDAGATEEEIKFIMRGAVAADLKSTLRDANVHDYIMTDDNKLGGCDVFSSGVLPSDLIMAGDFSGVTIAEWAGLELDLDTTTLRASGQIIPTVWCDMDIAVTDPSRLFVMQAKAPASK
ncbi:phage major capsid protein [Enterobacter hormaechei]|uniref:phage major capsid family protein n=1 Tax=Enterobacter hormaechei TaxID=158836 RepID=UPI00207C8764|nr:phage major capsid protein [Enterobacter hormaechei]MCO0811951.1 phage major capsid protein [Enterobacter hormaechei]